MTAVHAEFRDGVALENLESGQLQPFPWSPLSRKHGPPLSQPILTQRALAVPLQLTQLLVPFLTLLLVILERRGV